ncbi:FAD-dependent monooxygenase [Mucilaginibacter sp.]|uniref:FAD-dependent monooxygenase n=1 Tax=Mucilaginibacter sp. TaxID=1882438 RepID=UPI00374CF81F
MRNNNAKYLLCTDIIIIGAGPTGLMAACQLARFGVDLIIIDAKGGTTPESRAILVTARSMEIYQQMGLSDEVLAQGEYIRDLSIYINGKEKVGFSLGKAGNGLTDFPYLQSFEQSKNESLLYEQLKKMDRDVLWRTELVDLEQSAEGVTVKLQDLVTKKHLEVRAKYLIGCDGASSTVRQQLKCKFEGRTYENKFFVADTRINWAQPAHRIVASTSRTNFCAFFPMYDKESYRVLGTLPRNFYNREDIVFEDIESVVRSTIGIPLQFKMVNWFSVYKLHQRCVESFAVNRCFLAGDAAHIHSPAGGQGMNTGLQDAYNLSWKLWMVLAGTAGESLLSTYHAERYPFAKWLLTFTDRIFGFMTGDHLFFHLLRKHLLPFIFKIVSISPRIKKRIFRTLSQTWYAYEGSLLSVHSKQSLTFKAGDRFPYVRIDHKGELISCYNLLTAAKFHLVCIGADSNGNNDGIPKALVPLIQPVNLPSSPGWLKLGVKKKLYILVRPDNYIGLISDRMDDNSLEKYFRLYR